MYKNIHLPNRERKKRWNSWHSISGAEAYNRRFSCTVNALISIEISLKLYVKTTADMYDFSSKSHVLVILVLFLKSISPFVCHVYVLLEWIKTGNRRSFFFVKLPKKEKESDIQSLFLMIADVFILKVQCSAFDLYSLLFICNTMNYECIRVELVDGMTLWIFWAIENLLTAAPRKKVATVCDGIFDNRLTIKNVLIWR